MLPHLWCSMAKVCMTISQRADYCCTLLGVRGCASMIQLNIRLCTCLRLAHSSDVHALPIELDASRWLPWKGILYCWVNTQCHVQNGFKSMHYRKQHSKSHTPVHCKDHLLCCMHSNCHNRLLICMHHMQGSEPSCGVSSSHAAAFGSITQIWVHGNFHLLSACTATVTINCDPCMHHVQSTLGQKHDPEWTARFPPAP